MNYKTVTNKPMDNIEENNIDGLNSIEIIRLNGYEVISYSSLKQFNETVRETAKKIVRSFNKSSDLIGVIAAAITDHYDHVKYILSAPSTTAKIDVEFVLKQLLSVKIVNDFYYSEHSNSYLVEINSSSDKNIDDVLRIGLMELIGTKYNTYIDLVIRKDSDAKRIEITFVKEDELFIIHTAFGVDLDIKSDLHDEKIEKLKNTIVNNRMKLNSVSFREIWIVSDLTKKQLYPLNNVMSICDLEDF